MKTIKELSDQYDITLLQECFEQYSVKLNEKQISQFLKYYELLLEWNSFMNLTGITEYQDVVRKHFTDSVSLAAYMDLSGVNTLIDVGTGAGFHRIPLKIIFPHLQVTLLDSLYKRIRFLDEVIRELELTGIETIHGRAEDFARPGRLRESFDVCVCPEQWRICLYSANIVFHLLRLAVFLLLINQKKVLKNYYVQKEQ